ncbi:MAG TPA: hypothetical protein VI953_01470 [Candidatus Paceibacterota bacterium]
MKYDYLGSPQSDPAKPWRWRPWLEVQFIGEHGKKLKTVGLVDSGADEILLDEKLAPVLGVDLEKCEHGTTMGIGGEQQHFRRTILDLLVKHMEEPIRVPVCFTKLSVACLLGQEGFFDDYKVRFERDHKTFELVPVKKSGKV